MDLICSNCGRTVTQTDAQASLKPDRDSKKHVIPGQESYHCDFCGTLVYRECDGVPVPSNRDQIDLFPVV